MEQAIVKKIWILWFQGMNNAPELVLASVKSWKLLNPEYEVIFITDDNLHEFVDVSRFPESFTQLSLAHQSDFIRLRLLMDYGGFWVDATCLCNQPLSTWVKPYTKQGFFAFANPGRDRMLSNWFLYSDKNNYIVCLMYNAVVDFWSQKSDRKRFKIHFFERVLNLMPSIWFCQVLANKMGFYSYRWFHYIFYQLYMIDNEFKCLWDKVPKYSADIPHRLNAYGFLNKMTQSTKDAMLLKKDPLYKLSHKVILNDDDESAVYMMIKDYL